MPEISIIMPVHNTPESFLRQSIDSVLRQTMTDFEFIIINDGSASQTTNILQEYANTDNRVIVLNHPTNQGTAIARNNGLHLAEGKYISFIDSDDVVNPNFLHILYDTMTTTQSDISCCDFYKLTTSPSVSDYFSTPQTHCSNSPIADFTANKQHITFNVWNKLYKKSSLNNLSFDKHNIFEDWVFISMLLPRISRICWTTQKLYGYRIHNNSTMRSEFTLAKVDSYINGIKKVYSYYKNYYPQYLQHTCQPRLSQSLKMLINRAGKSPKQAIKHYTRKKVKEIYSDGIVGYQGLSLKNKFRLWKILHL